MVTATVATAAGAAALLYYTLNRRLQCCTNKRDNEENYSVSDVSTKMPLGIDRVSHRLIRAPGTWLETISTLSETLRFTYSETLGKWPFGDLAFGISFLLKRQGNFLADSVFGGGDSIRLKGSEVTAELKYLLNLLTLCWHFSKKPLPLFLDETGYTEENVLLQESKAGILKPAFTVIADHKTRCFLLLIRGTHSIKDTLTAATGAVVPFHHTVVHEGGVRDLVLGYARCGMVAAARWIAKVATPCLIEAIGKNPDYKVKIVGHSLGGGTAALLTYILREQKELSETSCVTFAPGACMTWELAVSGNDFITSVINGADLVPTFSAASVDDLRAEVTASAWINYFRNQIEQTRILSTVYRSASALGSHLPSIATARATVAGAGAILRPVSNGTQVVMRRAHSMAQAAWRRPALGLSSLSCMRPRCHVMVDSHSNCPEDLNSSKCSAFAIEESSEPLVSSRKAMHGAASLQNIDLPVSSPARECSCISKMNPDSDNDSDRDENHHHRPGNSMNEVELLKQLKHELCDTTEGDDTDVTNEIREEEEEEVAAMEEETDSQTLNLAQKVKEVHRFFPPGRIMHIVKLNPSPAKCEENEASPTSSSGSDINSHPDDDETKIGIILTSRSLYCKVRLSQTMISDHFMPVYIRQIERLIKELEVEEDHIELQR